MVEFILLLGEEPEADYEVQVEAQVLTGTSTATLIAIARFIGTFPRSWKIGSATLYLCTEWTENRTGNWGRRQDLGRWIASRVPVMSFNLVFSRGALHVANRINLLRNFSMKGFKEWIELEADDDDYTLSRG